MDYLTFNNGKQMPILGFGTWEVRGEDGKNSILSALEVGYRLIDTAQMYQNENIVGAAIKESGIPREEIFITTKLYKDCDSYSKSKEGIEKSLECLQTNYIDLVLLHEPYENSQEMYKALEDAYATGLVKSIGISNFNEEAFVKFVGSCKIIPAINQVESHIYHPRFELQRVMKEYGTKMQSWGSFTEGKRNIFDENVLEKIGKVHQKTTGQIALKYLVQQGIGVIPKSSHKNRMQENFDIFDFELSTEEIEHIDTLNDGQTLFGWH